MSSRRRKWKFRLRHIIEAAERIQGYVAGMSAEAFAADQRTIDAVLRNLMVIGEAAWQVPDAVTTRYPSVPWDRMRGMRNLVAHEYDRVNLDVVWRTLETDLAPVISMLQGVLSAEGPDE